MIRLNAIKTFYLKFTRIVDVKTTNANYSNAHIFLHINSKNENNILP